jgi:hypothetical protein
MADDRGGKLSVLPMGSVFEPGQWSPWLAILTSSALRRNVRNHARGHTNLEWRAR